MSRRTLAITLAAVLGALAAIVWLDRPRDPQVVAAGAPLPLGEKVEMRFQNPDGETETWKLEKKETTRDEAIAADPDDRVPRSNAGRLLTLMTDYPSALPHLERAAALAPGDPQVWLDLQTLYQRAQRLDAAFEARARADALLRGRRVVVDEHGFYQLEGTAAIP